ncbi:hypothetical protein [Agrobacterium vitis]|uniref:hypothetical protein n=1 Tax=Agrobacterium vitis TaxID=373 RepID=UPI001F2A1997|nr:hypothetical protein [Agrobacterium vitis]
MITPLRGDELFLEQLTGHQAGRTILGNADEHVDLALLQIFGNAGLVGMVKGSLAWSALNLTWGMRSGARIETELSVAGSNILAVPMKVLSWSSSLTARVAGPAHAATPPSRGRRRKE